MAVDCILIPVIRSEWCVLVDYLYNMPRPASQSVPLSLVMSLDAEWMAEEKIFLRKLIGSTLAGRNFNRIEFISCCIPPPQSVYLRTRVQKYYEAPLPYGLKSGPNMQFFRSIREVIGRQICRHALILLETDAIPLMDGWIERLNCDLAGMRSDFLVAGARYEGEDTLPESIREHVNGNAVYNLSHPQFEPFLADWEGLLLEAVKKEPDLPYDVAIEWAFANQDVLNKHSGQYLQKLEPLYRSNVKHLKRMVNIAGQHEYSAEYIFRVDSFWKQFPEAVILHCKAALPYARHLRAKKVFIKADKFLIMDCRRRFRNRLKLRSGINNSDPDIMQRSFSKDELPDNELFDGGAKQNWIYRMAEELLTNSSNDQHAISVFALACALRIRTDTGAFAAALTQVPILRKALRHTLNTVESRVRKTLLKTMIRRHFQWF